MTPYDQLPGFPFYPKGNLGDNTAAPIPYNGGAGTVYLKENLAAQGDLIVDNGNIDTNSGDFSTPIPAIGPGTSTALSTNLLTDSIRTYLTNRLTGIELRLRTL